MHAKQLSILINPPEVTEISREETKTQCLIQFGNTVDLNISLSIDNRVLSPPPHTHTQLMSYLQYVIHSDCQFLYCSMGELAFLFCFVGGNLA